MHHGTIRTNGAQPKKHSDQPPIIDIHHELLELQCQIEKQERVQSQECQAYKQEIAMLTQHSDQQNQEFKKLCSANNALLLQLDSLTNELNEVLRQNCLLNQEVKDLQSAQQKREVNTSELNEEIIYRDAFIKKLQSDQVDKNTLAAYQDQIAELQDQNKKMAADKDRAITKQVELKMQLDLAKEDIKNWQDQYEKQKKQIQKVQRQNNELVDELNLSHQAKREIVRQQEQHQVGRDSQSISELQTTITQQKEVMNKQHQELRQLKDQLMEHSLQEKRQSRKSRPQTPKRRNDQIDDLEYDLEMKDALMRQYESKNASLKSRLNISELGASLNSSYSQYRAEKDISPVSSYRTRRTYK